MHSAAGFDLNGTSGGVEIENQMVRLDASLTRKAAPPFPPFERMRKRAL